MSGKHRSKHQTSTGRGLISVMAMLLLIMLIGGGFLFLRQARRARVIVNYEDIIRTEAQKNELEPAYVAAVIMAESSYRPEIVSSADARGLMQLLPETAQDMARLLGEVYQEELLLEPETNIRYGCRYLRWLMDTLHTEDMATTSAAYYQGPGRVRNWLNDPAYSQDGVTLTQFGTESTETYVTRILKYYKEYSKIYAQT